VLLPAEDAAPANWLVESLTTFAVDVRSLVPAGFAGYVRIFHPASLAERPVPWTEIAAANGRVAHAGMQFPALVGKPPHAPDVAQSGLFDRPPVEGALPRALVPPLVSVLSRRTRTPERCWFAVWEGFGALPDHVRRAPRFELPQRSYRLLSGAVADLGSALPPPWWQPPNLWWPEDRAWCVATEIDLHSTYVGGDTACTEELAAQRELEALPVDPTTGVSFASDTLN